MKKQYLFIIMVGFLVRLIWSILVPVDPVSDSFAYDTFAQNIAKGQGYGWTAGNPSAYWAVGTSFIYSIFYSIFGHSYVPIIALNLFLSALIMGISMLLAEKWFNERVAIITGVLLALWPSQIQFCTVLASELIFTALVLVTIFVWFNEKMTLRSRALLVGLTLAGATYVRPTALLIPILLLFIRCVDTKEIFKSFIATIIVFIVMGLLIAPWSYRNYQVFGQFVMISTSGGVNLWMGNNPDATGGYIKIPDEVRIKIKGMNEVERNQYLKSQGVDYIKENPLEFIKNSLIKLIKTHDRESIGIAWNQKGLVNRYGRVILLPLKLINQGYWLSVLILALTGIIILGKQQGWLSVVTHPTVVFWGYFAFIHMILVAIDRYHFPSIPMIAILAALTLSSWNFKKDRIYKNPSI